MPKPNPKKENLESGWNKGLEKARGVPKLRLGEVSRTVRVRGIEELFAQLEAMLKQGLTIPEPTAKSYSGGFRVRLPKSLHRRLAETAAREGVSLNGLVMSLLSSGVAGATTPDAAGATTPDVAGNATSPGRP